MLAVGIAVRMGFRKAEEDDSRKEETENERSGEDSSRD